MIGLNRYFFIISILLIISNSESYSQDSLKINKKSFNLDSLKSVKQDTSNKAKLAKLKIEYTNTLQKTFGIIPYKPKEEPKIVFIRSMILPGWGQITNKKQNVIKLPIIFGSAAVGAYFIYDNNRRFKEYKGYLLEMAEKKTSEITINGNGPYSKDLVNNAAKQYRRWKQGTIIGYSVGWLLFAVEANVTAHLKNFDENDDISFKIIPKFVDHKANFMMGAGLNINLK